MNTTVNRLRRILCTFSGEDDYIIRRCDRSIQMSFASIGAFVLLIFVGCWVSASSFMLQLFDGSSRWISFPVGIIWALLVTNLYLLLLYTVSPTLLPVVFTRFDGKKNITIYDSTKQKSVFTFSMVSRLSLITLLAIIIAQPLNVMLLSSFAENSLENYKTEYKVSMMIDADSSLIKQEIVCKIDFEHKVNTIASLTDSATIANGTELLNDKVMADVYFLIQSKTLLDSLNKWNNISDNQATLIKLDSVRNKLAEMLEGEIRSDDSFISNIDNIGFSNRLLEKEFEVYRKSLKNAIATKIDNYNRLNSLLDRSNFYVKRIQILLSKTVFSWLITLLICLVFLLPIYWKFRIRNRTEFYEKKKEIENKLVMQDYEEFKSIYEEIFRIKLAKINSETRLLLNPAIKRLHVVNPRKAEDLITDMNKELADEPVRKYEYWADHPFRTKRKQTIRNLATESDLINTLYNQST